MYAISLLGFLTIPVVSFLTDHFEQNAPRTPRRHRVKMSGAKRNFAPARRRTAMSLQQAITEFRGQFRGAVLEPGTRRTRRSEKSITR